MAPLLSFTDKRVGTEFLSTDYSLVCLFAYSTVRSTAFTTKDIVVSGSDDRTVKVSIMLIRRTKKELISWL